MRGKILFHDLDLFSFHESLFYGSADVITWIVFGARICQICFEILENRFIVSL